VVVADVRESLGVGGELLDGQPVRQPGCPTGAGTEFVAPTALQCSTDERGFNRLRQLRDEYGGNTTLADFNAILRVQVAMLRIDEAAAPVAIPDIPARDARHIDRARDALSRFVAVARPLSETSTVRLSEVSELFGGLPEAPSAVSSPTLCGSIRTARRWA